MRLRSQPRPTNLSGAAPSRVPNIRLSNASRSVIRGSKSTKSSRSVFAIYEPHQAEETISYLIVGEKQALLFDTGMGISDIRKVTA